MKPYLKVLLFVCIVPLVAYAAVLLEEQAPPSLADHLHLSHSKDPVDGGWLPNLTGLPTKDQIFFTPRMVDAMVDNKDRQCAQVDFNLRLMMFQHFVIYQQLVNAQGIYLDESTARQWAHILAMVLKESSGDSSSITDMSGRSMSTYRPKTNLEQWQKVLEQKGIEVNSQTNFGLTQTSADRLFNAFRLAQSQQYNTAYLEGRQGAETPGKIDLNTAIAIRRLIWFYQDFAQGRIVDSDKRIHQRDINKPEFYQRYKDGLDMALLYCGTRFMFREGYSKTGKVDLTPLQNAMASIAYCKLGNSQSGYGTNEIDEKCFAEWVTLCPALNIDIAMLTPLSYFATRDATPVCENTFKQLLNKKP